MLTIKLDKVYFGATMTAYTGRSDLNWVGKQGVLVVYRAVGTEDECAPIFYFDNGPTIKWLRHSHSRFTLEDGVFTAVSLHSGSVKSYEVKDAVEKGAEVFHIDRSDGGPLLQYLAIDELASRGVPVEWLGVFVSIFADHAWEDSPVLEVR